MRRGAEAQRRRGAEAQRRRAASVRGYNKVVSAAFAPYRVRPFEFAPILYRVRPHTFRVRPHRVEFAPRLSKLVAIEHCKQVRTKTSFGILIDRRPF